MNNFFTVKILFLACFGFFISQQVIAQQGEWTWMSGSNTINGTENYGTQGVPSVSNHPSGLYEACEWTDTSGMFWLYGGTSVSQTLANLWKYNPSTNEWTWVKGPGNSYISPVYGTQGVPAPANTPGARGYGAASFVGKDNTLWLFGGIGPYNDLWKYNITTNEWTWMKGPNVTSDPGSYGTQGVSSPSNVPPSRSECAASWTDSLGNLWLFGGWSNSDSYNDLWKYDPVTNEWTWMKGSSTVGAADVYGTKGVPAPANTPGARNSYGKWNDGKNNLYLFGGDRFTAGQLRNDVWKYNIATNEWVWISGTKNPNSNENVTAQCTPDVSFYPSCRREGRFCWVDPCKKFWMFGGSSHGGFDGSHNDLWKFDPVTLEWTWVSGSLALLQNGSFGTKGVSSPTNVPPCHSGGNAWCDKQGNLWLLGGTDVSWPNAWNDLWRYVPDSLCGGTSCAVVNQPQINFSSSDTDVCQKLCIDFFDESTNNPTSWQWSFPGGSPSSSSQQNPAQICYNSPGTYDVTLITSGPGGNDTLVLTGFVTVYATPPFPTITINGYVLTSSYASSYQWQFNSVDIPGATNQSYTATQTGYYTVIITDENGCVSSATVYVEITGVENVFGDPGISVYPNPSNGNFVIIFSGAAVADAGSIEIVNALGQTVFSAEEQLSVVHKTEIEITGITSGVYFLEVKTRDGFFRKKILITH